MPLTLSLCYCLDMVSDVALGTGLKDAVNAFVPKIAKCHRPGSTLLYPQRNA